MKLEEELDRALKQYEGISADNKNQARETYMRELLSIYRNYANAELLKKELEKRGLAA